jgi:hypothetical protein
MCFGWGIGVFGVESERQFRRMWAGVNDKV